MDGVFASRKESFLNSLEKAISTISSDKYVKQMFEDQHSATYVPDRICELIRQVLLSDREDEINRLYDKIYGIEFFFDEDKIKQIENLGKKYSNAKNLTNGNNNWSSPNNFSFNNFTYGFSDIADYNGPKSMQGTNNLNQSQNFKKKTEDVVAFCRILNQQIRSLDQNSLVIEKNEQIPRTIRDLKRSVQELKNAMISMRRDFPTLLKHIKNQSLKIYEMSTEKVKSECVQKVKNAKYYINKQNEQIKQLSITNSNMYDSESVSVLEDNIKKLKAKLSQSENTVANSIDKISTLQRQLLTEKNLNANLEDKINVLTLENRQITEEVNRLNSFLVEKQQRIEYLEQSMSNIENEILEPDQMNKIQQKVTNLNDTIKKIQNENDSLLKKSGLNDRIISNLMNLTNTAQSTELVTKVDRLYKEKVKICQLLNRSVHSDASKAVEMICQTHEALKSILNISDDSKLVSEIQNLREQKKSAQKLAEKEAEMGDIYRALKVTNEKDLKNQVQALQRAKSSFDKLCSDCGIKLDDDQNSLNYNLPETVMRLQKYYLKAKEMMSILNLRPQDNVKEVLTNLVDVKNKASQLCELFRIKNFNNNSGVIPGSKLLQVAKNLIKVKESYDTVVSSLNSNLVAFNKNDSFMILDFEEFDEEKAKKAKLNARSYILMKSNLKTLCELLKIDFKLPVRKILSILIVQVKSLVKSKDYYDKVVSLLETNDNDELINDDSGILTIDKTINKIRSLLQSSRSKSSEKVSRNPDKVVRISEKVVRSSEKVGNRQDIAAVLGMNKNSNVANEVSEMWNTLKDLCSIFKIEQPNLNSASSSSSLRSTHKSLCSLAKMIQDSQSKNLSSVYSINIRLRHFKQVLNGLQKSNNHNISSYDNNDDGDDDDLHNMENEIVQIMNDLSNIFVTFGTSDYNEIKMAKTSFDMQKKEIGKLIQITGKDSLNESIDFLSKFFLNLKQSSTFLSRLFRILLLIPESPISSNKSANNSPILSSVDAVPLPIPRAVQDRLIKLASQQSIEKVQLKKVCDKIIDKARAVGFSVSDNRKNNGFETEIIGFSNNFEDNEYHYNDNIYHIDSALKFIVENAKHEAETKFESQRALFERRLTSSYDDFQSSKIEYKNKIEELMQTIASLRSKKAENDELQSIEIQDLRNKLEEARLMLENEKQIRSELMSAIGGKETKDDILVRSRMSENELRLLSKAEKTRKVVDEMKKKKKKEEFQNTLRFQTNDF